jgi:hypothetical protein
MRVRFDLLDPEPRWRLWSSLRPHSPQCGPTDLLLPDWPLQCCFRPDPQYADRKHRRHVTLLLCIFQYFLACTNVFFRTYKEGSYQRSSIPGLLHG